MMDYDTYTFSHKSHYNEFCPDVNIEFKTHQEETLEDVLYMVNRFLLACGHSERSIKDAMSEFADE